LLHLPGTTTAQIDARVKGCSVLQRLPFAKRHYRAFLPLYPWAARSLKLEGYDLVVSLSHAAAKNVRVPAGSAHISYCFTPMRYIWDQAPQYFGAGLSLAWPLVKALRIWDRAGSGGVGEFVAISRFVGARIRCFYGRKATVIYPPVDTSWIKSAQPGKEGEAFLYAGALVPYKRVDLVVEAFNRIGAPLWIVGQGPLYKQLRKSARQNIVFQGYVADADLSEAYRRCRALVFPVTEDFGMVPVECMAAGRPVIALDHGGARETVKGLRFWENGRSTRDLLAVGEASGVFIQNRGGGGQLEALMSAISCFIKNEGSFSREVCARQAALFAPQRFLSEWRSLTGRLGLAPESCGVSKA